jgi:hypothetical protein
MGPGTTAGSETGQEMRKPTTEGLQKSMNDNSCTVVDIKLAEVKATAASGEFLRGPRRQKCRFTDALVCTRVQPQSRSERHLETLSLN